MPTGPLEWMAWTTPTAIFFVAVFAMLTFMSILSARVPSVARQGFLPLETTRGDRLYIGLISSAFILLGWLALSDSTLWGGVAVCVLWMALILRWG